MMSNHLKGLAVDRNEINTIIVTHSADPDGFVSAVLIAKILNDSRIPYELRFADHCNFREVITSLALERDKSIYILDMPLSASKIPNNILDTLVSSNRIYNFDHHNVEEERYVFLLTKTELFITTNEKICTARLIAEYYGLEGSEIELLVEIAQATDYDGSIEPNRTELGKELLRCIIPCSDVEWHFIINTLLRGLKDSRIWRNGYRLTGELAIGAGRTHEAMKADLDTLKASVSSHKLLTESESPVTVFMTFASECVYMKPAMDYITSKYPSAHVCIVLFNSRSVVARLGQSSSDKSIPLVPFLSEKTDGGGRDGRGGFCYDSATDPGNYVSRRDSLLDDFEAYIRKSRE